MLVHFILTEYKTPSVTLHITRFRKNWIDCDYFVWFYMCNIFYTFSFFEKISNRFMTTHWLPKEKSLLTKSFLDFWDEVSFIASDILGLVVDLDLHQLLINPGNLQVILNLIFHLINWSKCFPFRCLCRRLIMFSFYLVFIICLACLHLGSVLLFATYHIASFTK